MTGKLQEVCRGDVKINFGNVWEQFVERQERADYLVGRRKYDSVALA